MNTGGPPYEPAGQWPLHLPPPPRPTFDYDDRLRDAVLLAHYATSDDGGDTVTCADCGDEWPCNPYKLAAGLALADPMKMSVADFEAWRRDPATLQRGRLTADDVQYMVLPDVVDTGGPEYHGDDWVQIYDAQGANELVQRADLPLVPAPGHYDNLRITHEPKRSRFKWRRAKHRRRRGH